MSSKSTNTKNKWYRPIVRLFILSSLTFLVTTIILTVLLSFINPNLTMLMVSKRHSTNDQGGGERIRKNWVSIENISPNAVLAVCAAEDGKFMEHNGFDWEAINKAMKSNKKGKKLCGASTISQQTAKNVFYGRNVHGLEKGLRHILLF